MKSDKDGRNQSLCACVCVKDCVSGGDWISLLCSLQFCVKLNKVKLKDFILHSHKFGGLERDI